MLLLLLLLLLPLLTLPRSINRFIRLSFYSNPPTKANPFSPPHGSMLLDPSSTKGLEAKSNCGERRTTNATICDPRLRTANTQASCGSKEDFYYFSPWRAPGSAPVIDACGSAGGRFPHQSLGPAGAQYQNTSLAREGDAGGFWVDREEG